MKAFLKIFMLVGIIAGLGAMRTSTLAATSRVAGCWKCELSTDGQHTSCAEAKTGGAVDCDGNMSKTSCSIAGYAACPGDETEFSAAGEVADGIPTTVDPEKTVQTRCGLILQRAYSAAEGNQIRSATSIIGL